ncbi:hypothetical protein MGYG_07402 [Nannizzia gypsea CBS 118893]|uniref:Uncharacterized protein n=1 Tax=Arthroderma gypseum (strain ATCC MYA-4604 / CBS 118893) TaxID=535722 RepID=E4V322_ARTGP|nr:hypothetical protein MGYG_07402 [Nannizzia gypsea CBS 118893]EFR04396.1 hypothetical protein MGYG_07402 [Nannizzia gypsea CBS 118893]
MVDMVDYNNDVISFSRYHGMRTNPSWEDSTPVSVGTTSERAKRQEEWKKGGK